MGADDKSEYGEDKPGGDVDSRSDDDDPEIDDEELETDTEGSKTVVKDPEMEDEEPQAHKDDEKIHDGETEPHSVEEQQTQKGKQETNVQEHDTQSSDNETNKNEDSLSNVEESDPESGKKDADVKEPVNNDDHQDKKGAEINKDPETKTEQPTTDDKGSETQNNKEAHGEKKPQTHVDGKTTGNESSDTKNSSDSSVNHDESQLVDDNEAPLIDPWAFLGDQDWGHFKAQEICLCKDGYCYCKDVPLVARNTLPRSFNDVVNDGSDLCQCPEDVLGPVDKLKAVNWCRTCHGKALEVRDVGSQAISDSEDSQKNACKCLIWGDVRYCQCEHPLHTHDGTAKFRLIEGAEEN
ncbi:hypothetical protein FGRMN_597 [Fusarium graminum]|nr:hypothetical protein FGRMN_597 [Fusarium graminum]